MEQIDWKIPRFADNIDNSLSELGFTPLLAAVLMAKGARTPEEARRYLMRDESLIGDSFQLPDIEKATARIELAFEKHEKLAVYGDYDVDGISSACLIADYLTGRGLSCEIYIPDRLNEGYGVNCKALEELRDKGVSLVITVDCGITAVEETKYAKSLGMDMIITDHHECPQILPEACAVIDPKRKDSGYGFEELAGVGVALKLICALENDFMGTLERYADLVAVGTIADVMPLVGENRCIVYKGLEKLKNNPRPGFAALLEECGALKKPITASTVGFSLAPRINAAGRLCKTQTSVRLILSNDRDEASALAKELCGLNRQRQELETEVWEDAIAALSDETPHSPIVLESISWHPGVVGIAASRLTETYKLPTIMICVDEENGKGSCRSYGDFNLFEALSACAEHLESFGGHAFAAGINIKPEKIDDFRSALAEYYSVNLPEKCPSIEPQLLIFDPSTLSREGVESLSELEPCGSGNEAPLMCIFDARLETVTPIGNGKHLRLRISKNGRPFDCVYFSCTAESLGAREGDAIDICFTPQINEFRSQRTVQLLVADVRKSRVPQMCKEIIESDGVSADELLAFRPNRNELASIWRTIVQLGGSIDVDYEKLAQKFDFVEPVKFCLGIRIFSELGLININSNAKRLIGTTCGSVEKTELRKSPLFRILWESVPQNT